MDDGSTDSGIIKDQMVDFLLDPERAASLSIKNPKTEKLK